MIPAKTHKTLRITPTAERHVPAVPVLIAVSAGIVADWSLSWNAVVWIGLATCCAMTWIVLFLRRADRLGAAILLCACGCAGAAMHHIQWSLVEADALLSYATDQPRPVHLLATVDTAPVVIPAEQSDFPTAIPPRDRSVGTLRAIALINDGVDGIRIPVSGRVRLDVQGVLPQLSRGTEVEIWGTLAQPSVARNPGGFDFRMFLREQSVYTLIRCQFPEAVQVRSAPMNSWLPDVSTWQAVIAKRLRQHLNPHNGPLAIALLLGPRTDISPEMKQAFLHSGTVHFLAISGINVAILVLFLWPLTRLTRLPKTARLIVLAVCVAGYVMITDIDPPVLRAAILVWATLLSLVSGRPTAPMNLLAVAGLIILVANPHDLFQVGAQLSFLAILALHWLLSLRWIFSTAPEDPFEEVTERWWQSRLRTIRQGIWDAFLTTCAVWIFTTPLVLARFHLISPVGFLVNILLPFWVTIMLWLGYVCLLAAVVCPPLLLLTCPFFDWSLTVFAAVVHYAAEIPWGHFKLLGPTDAWLSIFYALIMGAGSGLLRDRWQAWSWRLILVWCVGGLAWGALPQSQQRLRCTILSVGHGAAVLIELPNQQTILYDGGSLEDAKRARLAIESALIARGKVRLDAVIISHADIDHFNALPGLLENLAVREVLVSPTFLDFRQLSVRKMCEASIAAGVPIKLVWSDDKLRSDPDVELEILQPPAKGFGPDDNTNSLVLSIRYAGRGLLLTGDLEKIGLQSLLQRPPRAHDILLAPHHGSLKANPPDLARWVAPRWVVVSGGGDASFEKLRPHYGDGVTLLSTTRQGAVTIEINPQGEIDVTTQLMPVVSSP